MDGSNAGHYTSSVYSDEDTQYTLASAEYSVTDRHYTSLSSPRYVASSIYAPSRQTVLRSQYFTEPDNAPAISTQYGTTSSAVATGCTTLTAQELRRHDSQLQNDRRHARSGHRSHRRRPHAASGTTNAALTRQESQDQVTRSNTGMTPSSRVQQQYNGHPQVNTPHYHTTSPQQHYTPSSSTTHSNSSSSTPHDEQYSHTQYTPPSSINSTGYNQPQDTTYWTQYTPSSTQGKDLTDWGYDLAGVGTQFHGNSSQQYAS